MVVDEGRSAIHNGLRASPPPFSPVSPPISPNRPCTSFVSPPHLRPYLRPHLRQVRKKNADQCKLLGVVVGRPLPNKGTCAHYKHSYRWLRFPCCGRAYPCAACRP